ncbi:hypothetical protein [Brucella intermedia]|uniref:hypothetical protein n=1 Tax=Brucella intermedia TaxID=94625 RepID=UPI000AEA8E6C|nr:hypothetical protein [Brucella intermedia]
MLLRQFFPERHLDFDNTGLTPCQLSTNQLHRSLPPETFLHAFLEIRFGYTVC